MPGFKSHPLDVPLNAIVKALNDADQQMAQMTKDMGEFDSKELTPEEDELVFHNPHLRHLGQANPDTGLPYTNAQAAQQLLAELGPEQYVQYVDDFVRRADRRAREGQPDATNASPGVADVAAQPVPESDVGPAGGAVPAATDALA